MKLFALLLSSVASGGVIFLSPLNTLMLQELRGIAEAELEIQRLNCENIFTLKPSLNFDVTYLDIVFCLYIVYGAIHEMLVLYSLTYKAISILSFWSFAVFFTMSLIVTIVNSYLISYYYFCYEASFNR